MMWQDINFVMCLSSVFLILWPACEYEEIVQRDEIYGIILRGRGGSGECYNLIPNCPFALLKAFRSLIGHLINI